MNAKTTFAIVTMNMRDGSVQGHAAGCADLKRGVRKFAEPMQADYPIEVASKHEAWEDYNADFLAEGGEEDAYDIKWLPCADHVPATVEVAAEVETAVETTMKVCGKWTRFYQNGVEVGRVRNDAADAVFALIRG